MKLEMPEVDAKLIAKRLEIARDLTAIAGKDSVIVDEEGRKLFECDGLTMYKADPLVVVLPKNRQEVIEVMCYAKDKSIPVVTRGAGTGLTGGALPLEDGIMLGLSRMDNILEIDEENMCARVEPGVTNIMISAAVSDLGLFYAPDPSSQIACTIGGNVAENSGGAHCLKYGLTSNNLLGLQVVLEDGSVLEFGGKGIGMDDKDWMGVLTGSEGMLAVVTEITVRLRPLPEVAQAVLVGFDRIEDAAHCIEEVMARGITPACMEFMDKLSIESCEAFSGAGYPLDVDALMIVEFDGSPEEVEEDIERLRNIGKEFGFKHFKVSETEEEREKIWLGRKGAFSALGRLKPDYLTMDGTIARKNLAESLLKIYEKSQEYGLLVGNVFHAGDGNMHPLILFDREIAGQEEKAVAFAMDTLKISLDAGGVISGEHGIGVEKRSMMAEMFSSQDMIGQLAYKYAFDPDWRMNPGKVFPLDEVQQFREGRA